MVGVHTASYKDWSALGLRGRKADIGASYHDPVREESFEGDTHDRGGLVSVTWEWRLELVVVYAACILAAVSECRR